MCTPAHAATAVAHVAQLWLEQAASRSVAYDQRLDFEASIGDVGEMLVAAANLVRTLSAGVGDDARRALLDRIARTEDGLRRF